MRATVTCVCCRKQGPHESRGLRIACYRRHHRAGTLTRFPPTRHTDSRQPTGYGLTTLQRVAALDRAGYSPRSIGRQLNLSVQQVWRHLAEARGQGVR